MSPSTVYLITGSNRGIGFGLVSAILATHKDAFVYAGVRNPDAPSALTELKEKYPTQIALVRCVVGDVKNNSELAAEIEKQHGRVDTVVSNAAVGNFGGYVHDVNIDDFDQHLKINVTGAIILFQALYKLLKKSAHPRFIPVSAHGGSINGALVESPDVGCVAYCSSKAALNWVTRKIHFENEWLTAFPLSPGGIDTDMLRTAITKDESGVFGQVAKEITVPIEEAAPILVKIIDESTREKDGGQFVHIDGTRIPW